MEGVEARKCKVCVTGSGGYIASWLLKNLLMTGYSVNATFRDPGPFLTPTLPASIEPALPFITGNAEHLEWLKELLEWLKELHDIMGSILLVHTKDTCNAHIFLMEHPSWERSIYMFFSTTHSVRNGGFLC